jgi:hypothetical protein
MRALVFFACLYLATAADLFTADDARARRARALTDRAPVDRVVATITQGVAAMSKEEVTGTTCYTQGLHGNADWATIVEKYDTYETLLRDTLERLGYSINDIVRRARRITCECAKPPKDYEGGGYIACAMACHEGPHVRVCWE